MKDSGAVLILPDAWWWPPRLVGPVATDIPVSWVMELFSLFVSDGLERPLKVQKHVRLKVGVGQLIVMCVRIMARLSTWIQKMMFAITTIILPFLLLHCHTSSNAISSEKKSSCQVPLAQRWFTKCGHGRHTNKSSGYMFSTTSSLWRLQWGGGCSNVRPP